MLLRLVGLTATSNLKNTARIPIPALFYRRFFFSVLLLSYLHLLTSSALSPTNTADHQSKQYGRNSLKQRPTNYLNRSKRSYLIDSDDDITNDYKTSQYAAFSNNKNYNNMLDKRAFMKMNPLQSKINSFSELARGSGNYGNKIGSYDGNRMDTTNNNKGIDLINDFGNSFFPDSYLETSVKNPYNNKSPLSYYNYLANNNKKRAFMKIRPVKAFPSYETTYYNDRGAEKRAFFKIGSPAGGGFKRAFFKISPVAANKRAFLRLGPFEKKENYFNSDALLNDYYYKYGKGGDRGNFERFDGGDDGDYNDLLYQQSQDGDVRDKRPFLRMFPISQELKRAIFEAKEKVQNDKRAFFKINPLSKATKKHQSLLLGKLGFDETNNDDDDIFNHLSRLRSVDYSGSERDKRAFLRLAPLKQRSKSYYEPGRRDDKRDFYPAMLEKEFYFLTGPKIMAALRTGRFDKKANKLSAKDLNFFPNFSALLHALSMARDQAPVNGKRDYQMDERSRRKKRYFLRLQPISPERGK